MVAGNESPASRLHSRSISFAMKPFFLNVLTVKCVQAARFDQSIPEDRKEDEEGGGGRVCFLSDMHTDCGIFTHLHM